MTRTDTTRDVPGDLKTKTQREHERELEISNGQGSQDDGISSCTVNAEYNRMLSNASSSLNKDGVSSYVHRKNSRNG